VHPELIGERLLADALGFADRPKVAADGSL
jgi:hypothetical protein